MATILIVDDASTDLALMERVVKEAGHRTIVASDGKEAIALAKLHKPDMILLDVVMPVMDGFAACRAITKDQETASIPVVLVTSKSNDSDVFWGRKQGAVAHVAKPWDRQTIVDMIR